jgi:hypothetical protein
MDMNATAALLTPLAMALLGYAVLVAMLALALHPLRKRMFRTAESILAEGQWSADERARVNHLMDTCMSFRVGAIMPIAVISVILDDLLRREVRSTKSRTRLHRDHRFHQVIAIYLLSVMAANPLASAVTLPLLVLSAIIDKLMGQATVREVVEEPTLRALGSMPAVGDLKAA